MTLSIEGAIGAAWSAGTTLVLPGLTTTASNEPIIVLLTRNGGAPTIGVTSAHLTFTKRESTAVSNALDEWVALASGPLTSEIITCTFTSTPTYGEACAFGVLGAPASSYFDTNASIPLESTASTTPTFSTTATNTIVFGAVRSGSSSPTAGAGWTSIYSPSGGFFLAQYQVFSSAQSGTSFAGTSLGTPNGWVVDAIVSATPSAPTISSVNGGSAIQEGATGVAVVGTNFASGMTGAIIQSLSGTAGPSVPQTTTFVDTTDATFNLSMEPGSGDQLAYSDAIYTHKFQATVSGSSGSGSIAGGFTPPTGIIFETLTSINPSSPERITAIPDLVINDQLRASGNSAGTAPVPTGLSINPDATYQFANGDPAENFWVSVYDSVNFVWSVYALQTTGPVTAHGVVGPGVVGTGVVGSSVVGIGV